MTIKITGTDANIVTDIDTNTKTDAAGLGHITQKM